MAMGHPGKIHLDDLNYERRKYNGWEAYAQSKLANLLHAKQLARRLAGSSAVAVSVHPGWVRTRLMRHSMPAFVQDLPATRWVLGRLGLLEPWQGAQASLHALLAPEVLGQSGQYISQVGHYRDKACNKGGFPMVSPNPEANDEELGRQLWMASERLIQTALDRQRQVAG
jgi:hypothetical protein